MIIKVKKILMSRSFQNQIVDFYPEEGGWLSTEYILVMDIRHWSLVLHILHIYVHTLYLHTEKELDHCDLFSFKFMITF